MSRVVADAARSLRWLGAPARAQASALRAFTYRPERP